MKERVGVLTYTEGEFNITHIIRTRVSFFNIPKFVISAPKSSFELLD